ncbi:MAG TPA: hypothetical protein V6C89_18265 [Drouetiella sp.]|jgi:hypothetical protein
MLTSLLNALFGKPSASADSDSPSFQRAAERQESSRKAKASSPTQSSSRPNRSLRKVRSSWTQGRYDSVNKPSMQQHLNMLYAPAVKSLVDTEACVADVPVILPAEQSGALDFSPIEVPKPEEWNADPVLVGSHNARVCEVLAKIALHPDEEVRFFIATNQDTPEIGLRALANDPSERVRMALLGNSSCPEDVAKQLVCDRSSVVSFNAVTRIRRGWSQTKRTA